MATRFDKQKEDVNSIVLGYEGEKRPENFTIPSCGLEDLDFAVFNLFDEQIPLYYELQGERKKVPVIFATGERFAILRRNKPLTDKSGALILPLISISRNSVENVPAKGMTNNQMFPEVLARRISKENIEWRQQNNFEGFESIKHTSSRNKTGYNLMPNTKNNIYETIEIPPVRYFGATYEISIWSSFTQQANRILETIMSAYTINPGQQFKIESKKGYWFPAFIDSNFTQDANYADFTDAERYVKFNLNLNATGYILAPNIENGKVALKSLISSPTISFETLFQNEDFSPNVVGIPDNRADIHIFDEIKNEDDTQMSQQVGLSTLQNINNLNNFDQKHGYVVGESDLLPYDTVGERGSRDSKNKKVMITDSAGNIINVRATTSSNGETLYDQKYAEKIFNISNSNK